LEKKCRSVQLPDIAGGRVNHSWVEIDLGRLQENVRAVQSAVSAETEIIFVIKANAYGHGLVPVAKAAVEKGIKWFAVAYLDAAIALRNALPDAELLVIGHTGPDQIDLLLEHRITPIITDLENGLALAAAARECGKILPAHLKVDTGMGRLGIQWDEVGDVMEQFNRAGGLEISGVCSHFAKVEPDAPIDAVTQAEKFKAVLEYLPPNVFKHLSSSRAALFFPEWDFDGIRQGIDLYGYGASDPKGRFTTQPILQWKTRVAQVKRVPPGFAVGYYGTHTTEYPTQIATLAIGYADGYNRRLSNRGDVLIGGRRCAVVGRVSMNWITVDVGPDAVVKPGDEVVLIGKQGSEEIWANELSTICRTIPYEILTGINASLERKYI
jgi:alanine racemase